MPKSLEDVNDLHLLGLSQESVYQTDTLNSTPINLKVTVSEKEAPESRNSRACAGIGTCNVPPILAQPQLTASHNHFLACEEAVNYEDIKRFRVHPDSLWQHPVFLRADPFWKLVMLWWHQRATHKDTVYIFDRHEYPLKRGQVFYSRRRLAKELSISEDYIRGAKYYFEKENFISPLIPQEIPHPVTVINVIFSTYCDEELIYNPPDIPPAVPHKVQYPTIQNQNQKTDSDGTFRVLGGPKPRITKKDELQFDWDKKVVTGIQESHYEKWKAMFPNIQDFTPYLKIAEGRIASQPGRYRRRRGMTKTLQEFFLRDNERLALKSYPGRQSELNPPSSAAPPFTVEQLLADYHHPDYQMIFDYGRVEITTTEGYTAGTFTKADPQGFLKFLTDRKFTKKEKS